jgi:hypothetical protein
MDNLYGFYWSANHFRKLFLWFISILSLDLICVILNIINGPKGMRKLLFTANILEMRKKDDQRLKFIHSELVIALIALEFLFSWIARDYF